MVASAPAPIKPNLILSVIIHPRRLKIKKPSPKQRGRSIKHPRLGLLDPSDIYRLPTKKLTAMRSMAYNLIVLTPDGYVKLTACYGSV
jgi:hypothetical protein